MEAFDSNFRSPKIMSDFTLKKIVLQADKVDYFIEQKNS